MNSRVSTQYCERAGDEWRNRDEMRASDWGSILLQHRLAHESSIQHKWDSCSKIKFELAM